MAVGKGRSPTARRVWIWLDASDPREAAALSTYDRLQAGLPARVRASLLRDVVVRGLAEIEARMTDAGDAAERPAAPARIPEKTKAGGRRKKREPASKPTAARQAGGRQESSGPSSESGNRGGGGPPGLMW